MKTEDRIKRIVSLGFKIKPLGKKFKATRKGQIIKGSISSIFKQLFGY